MRLPAFVLALMVAVWCPRAAHAAQLGILIDLSEQTMTVKVDGRSTYRWLVSTARRGYRTPIGRFHPIRLERVWYSSKYDSAPMPYSIFFYGGYAIHGTWEIRRLGRPVSHGCVRLHPDNARILFGLVRSHGRRSTCDNDQALTAYAQHEWPLI
ncbi:L,D-transpeptidase [Mesorhizobium atlanticum]